MNLPAKIQPEINRLLLLRELITVMNGLNTPPPAELPTGPGLIDPKIASLATDAANSAVRIAHAVAALGQPAPGRTAAIAGTPDDDRAKIIWTETLAQMERIQERFNLKPYPFQQQTSPAPKSRD